MLEWTGMEWTSGMAESFKFPAVVFILSQLCKSMASHTEKGCENVGKICTRING